MSKCEKFQTSAAEWPARPNFEEEEDIYIHRTNMAEEEEEAVEDKSFLKVIYFEICVDGIYPPAPPDR